MYYRSLALFRIRKLLVVMDPDCSSHAAAELCSQSSPSFASEFNVKKDGALNDLVCVKDGDVNDKDTRSHSIELRLLAVLVILFGLVSTLDKRSSDLLSRLLSDLTRPIGSQASAGERDALYVATLSSIVVLILTWEYGLIVLLRGSGGLSNTSRCNMWSPLQMQGSRSGRSDKSIDPHKNMWLPLDEHDLGLSAHANDAATDAARRMLCSLFASSSEGFTCMYPKSGFRPENTANL